MNAKRFCCVVSSLAILCSLPALAAEAPLRQALLQCQQQQSATERLDCYDQLASSLTPQARGQQRAADRRAPQASDRRSEADFGAPAPRQQEQLDRIHATVIQVEKSARDQLIIHFDNGQTWQQNSAEFYPVEPGQEHYVRRAALGSFLMGNDRNNRTTRVRRVE